MLNSSTLESVRRCIRGDLAFIPVRKWSEMPKFELLANFGVLDQGCLHFDAGLNQVFQKNLLMPDEFCDIIAWGTLEEISLKSKESVPF